DGAEGKEGKAGKDGAGGKSVTASSLAPGEGGCVEGGTEVEVEGSGSPESICNGEEGPEGPEGSPWTDGGTLPPNATETGVWGLADLGENETVQVPLSFPIPLAAPLDGAHVEIKAAGYVGTVGANCPGKVSEPTAKSGFLCVYERTGHVGGVTYPPDNIGIEDPIARTSGTTVAGTTRTLVQSEKLMLD